MNEELILKVKEILDKYWDKNTFEGGRQHDGSFLFTKSAEEGTLIIGGQFILGHPNYRLQNFYQAISLDETENFLAPILSQFELGSKEDSPHTILLTDEVGRNRATFSLVSNLKCDISEPVEFGERLEKYCLDSIIPFFRDFTSTKKCYDYSKRIEFEEIINSAIRGEYPTNIYKVFYLEHKHGDQSRLTGLYEKLATWNEEDKSDPNYGHLYDKYVGSFNLLKEQLKMATNDKKT